MPLPFLRTWSIDDQYIEKRGFRGGSYGKESTCNVGDMDSIPGLGRSPVEENSYPLGYSGLENSMDRGPWQATVHGVTKSWTWLSLSRKSPISPQGFSWWLSGKESAHVQETQETRFWSLGRDDPLDEEMATHSSILNRKNCMDRGVWQAAVHGVTKSWTWLKWLSTQACTFYESHKIKSSKGHSILSQANSFLGVWLVMGPVDPHGYVSTSIHSLM